MLGENRGNVEKVPEPRTRLRIVGGENCLSDAAQRGSARASSPFPCSFKSANVVCFTFELQFCHKIHDSLLGEIPQLHMILMALSGVFLISGRPMQHAAAKGCQSDKSPEGGTDHARR